MDSRENMKERLAFHRQVMTSATLLFIASGMHLLKNYDAIVLNIENEKQIPTVIISIALFIVAILSSAAALYSTYYNINVLYKKKS